MAETVTDEALREEVRAWLADNWKPDLFKARDTSGWGTSEEVKAWLVKVADAGWAAPRLADRMGRAEGLSDA